MDHDEVIYNEYEQLKSTVKQDLVKKLSDFDWVKNLRLKAAAYIENNGRNVTNDEVTEFLLEEAFKTFPMNLRDEIMDKVDREIFDIISIIG